MINADSETCLCEEASACPAVTSMPTKPSSLRGAVRTVALHLEEEHKVARVCDYHDDERVRHVSHVMQWRVRTVDRVPRESDCSRDTVKHCFSTERITSDLSAVGSATSATKTKSGCSMSRDLNTKGTNSKRPRVQVMEVKMNDRGSSFQSCGVTCSLGAIEETTGDEEDD